MGNVSSIMTKHVAVKCRLDLFDYTVSQSFCRPIALGAIAVCCFKPTVNKANLIYLIVSFFRPVAPSHV